MASVGLRFIDSIGMPAASSLRLVIPLNGLPPTRTRRWQAICRAQAGTGGGRLKQVRWGVCPGRRE
jgi:hypothetical protein